MDAEFYNESSSLKLGWTPDWFGCSEFDEELTEAIRKYQKSIGLKADGLCGPGTYRRIWTDRESALPFLQEQVPEHKNTTLYVTGMCVLVRSLVLKCFKTEACQFIFS